jgi:hypothetical protein
MSFKLDIYSSHARNLKHDSHMLLMTSDELTA